MKRLSVVAALITCLTACANEPVITSDISQSGSEAGFAIVQHSGFDKAFIRPGTVLSNYTITEVDTLDLTQTKTIPPTKNLELAIEPWSLTEARKTELQHLWHRANPSTSLTGQGKKPLRLRAKLVEIAPSSNIENIEKAPSVIRVYTENSGHLAIELELIDAQSGRVIALLRDEKEAGITLWQQTSSVRVRQDYLWLFRQWHNRVNALLS